MRKMNLPNKLTMVRLCLVPVLIGVLLIPNPKAGGIQWGLRWYYTYAIALALFVALSLTDMLDGKIARKQGLITDFGKLMDPVADKFMVIGTMMVMLMRMSHYAAYDGFYRIPAFILFYFITLVAIIFRELGVTSLRMVLAGKGVVVPADKLGKIKTVSQIVCVCTLLIEPYIRRFIYNFGSKTFIWVRVPFLSWITVGVVLVTTVVSGVHYVKANWQHFTENW